MKGKKRGIRRTRRKQGTRRTCRICRTRRTRRTRGGVNCRLQDCIDLVDEFNRLLNELIKYFDIPRKQRKIVRNLLLKHAPKGFKDLNEQNIKFDIAKRLKSKDSLLKILNAELKDAKIQSSIEELVNGIEDEELYDLDLTGLVQKLIDEDLKEKGKEQKEN